ncbi:MAG: ATP-binding cassette domain-containing protein [Clostridia bacterium]|nr:ATP-binding cassette domain-containing protein [Clostridia bacterium]
MNETISVRGLSKSYGEKRVISSLTLDLPLGAVTALMGPSGCGKTTLAFLLAGLIPPDGGEISGVPEKKAFVFQEDRLAEEFSALSNVRFVLPGRDRKRAAELLARLGLGEELSRPVREFSGGMKRRVALARALAYDADILFLDEPFKGLDEKSREETVRCTLELTKGKTVIFITHDREEAEALGGGVIDLGALLAREQER